MVYEVVLHHVPRRHQRIIGGGGKKKYSDSKKGGPLTIFGPGRGILVVMNFLPLPP